MKTRPAPSLQGVREAFPRGVQLIFGKEIVFTMPENDDPKRQQTPDRALNALENLLGDVLEDLRVVHLFAGDGSVARRLLNAGARQAVCVEPDPPGSKLDAEGMVWIEMDPLEFFEEERVPDVGLVYVSAPEGTDLNREVLEQLPRARNLVENCLVLVQEPTWNKLLLDNFPTYELIEDLEYTGTRIAVTQMVSAPEDEG